MRSFPAFALVCLLAVGTPAALASSPADPSRPGPAAEPYDGSGQRGIPQTSDGVRGKIARPVPPYLRSFRDTSVRAQWQVAPGVEGMIWDEQDARGKIRAYLLVVNWRQPGLRVDYVNAGAVQRTATVSSMIARDSAIAGINGDFFDIGDTGAPLGVGRDRDRGLLNGPLAGWNSAFSFDAAGRPDISSLVVRARVEERPDLKITNVNSPEVAPGGIGLYTRAWGASSGSRWTGGQTRHVRSVLVRNGRVVSSTARLAQGRTINGQLLVGRGEGARQLARLRPGARITLRQRVQGAKRMAVTGNRFLVRDGLIEVVDDREMHPRTAIGIDRDTHRLLFLVIDGRQSFSRGYTMVELADKMIDLGADEALNLDGGGSSTLMAARRTGRVGLINSPSSGSQRRVANGIQITYRAP